MNVDDASDMYRNFLLWRKKNNVDQIRQEIMYGGRHSPFFFPKGKVIIDIAPQIIVTPNSRDRQGRPLCLEQYCFNPKDVMKVVSREDYLLFLTYALEYRAMVMEQVSHDLERQYMEQFNEEDRVDGYGVILLDYTIRDLKGVGFNHLGSDGRAILKAALELGLPNYPEYLGKSHMINVPSIFNAMWYFLKQIVDEASQAKFEFSGHDYLSALEKDISIENIPACLGGEFELYNEPFEFDVSESGPFFYPNAERDRQSFLRVTPYVTFDFETGDIKSVQLLGEQQANVVGANSSTVAEPVMTTVESSSVGKRAPSMKRATVTQATPVSLRQQATTFIHFWKHFFIYCWQQHRLFLLVGGLVTSYLVLFDPISIQSIMLICIIVYFTVLQ
jgi:hypothetical protein